MLAVPKDTQPKCDPAMQCFLSSFVRFSSTVQTGRTNSKVPAVPLSGDSWTSLLPRWYLATPSSHGDWLKGRSTMWSIFGKGLNLIHHQKPCGPSPSSLWHCGSKGVRCFQNGGAVGLRETCPSQKGRVPQRTGQLDPSKSQIQ